MGSYQDQDEQRFAEELISRLRLCCQPCRYEPDPVTGKPKRHPTGNRAAVTRLLLETGTIRSVTTIQRWLTGKARPHRYRWRKVDECLRKLDF